tara:strand:- start:7383 stop:8039 length:657 start_codon:yes stop_codon:yes gene_type:complete
MKPVQILILMLLCFSVKAQQDTLVQQRIARSFVREGNKLYKQKKYADAVVSYKKANTQVAAYFKSAFNLGNALYVQKNYKEAIPQYELAVKGTNNKIEKAAAYHNIGDAHMEEKEYDKAIAAFKNSLRENPNDDETRYNLALAKEKKKQKEEEDKKNEQPPPSEFAKRTKKQADKLLESFQFEKALKLMEAGLEKDMTMSNYKEYMQKLETVLEIESK